MVSAEIVVLCTASAFALSLGSTVAVVGIARFWPMVFLTVTNVGTAGFFILALWYAGIRL